MCYCCVATAGTLLHRYCCSAVAVVTASLRLLLLHCCCGCRVCGRQRERGWGAVAVGGGGREEWCYCKIQRENREVVDKEVLDFLHFNIIH